MIKERLYKSLNFGQRMNVVYYLEAAKNVKHTFFRWCSKQIFSPDIQIAAVNKTKQN